ncbi:hypothetical protein HGA34_01840 [Candidatus Falkowbacteria bacterium]|nr:hypothetical protein [Candidatus Falkowbacteria bacterium]
MENARKVALIFNKSFKSQTRQRSNPGVRAANLFWPKVINCIEKNEIACELTEDRVLKEHFAVGYSAANQLKEAYLSASEIRVVHAIDSRGLPTVTALFFKNPQPSRYYELAISFCPETGDPLLAGRAFQHNTRLAA